MTPFDTVAIVDWSSGNDTGPKPRRDAIWIGQTRNGRDSEPYYSRNRADAEAYLSKLIEKELSAGRRLFLGFDFPFGFPTGFAQGLAGKSDPFSVWDWLEARIEDSPRSNNRFDVAAEINAHFPGIGPFWFNGLKRDVPGLPRRDIRNGHGMAEKRDCEGQTRGAFPCWQMGGAGAVGGQILTGLPVLNRLRRRYHDNLAVWPFEACEAAVTLVEIWPGLINPVVKRAEASGGIRDAHQVRLLARAVAALPPDALAAMLDVHATEEGWIMGLGHEDQLQNAAEEQQPLRPPPLRNDCFALPAGVDWTPVEDALRHLQDNLHPVVSTETLPLADCLDRVLATGVAARRANPPQANTAVDGYGFAHESLGSGDQVLPLVDGRAAAGRPFGRALPPGHALRVLTGAALPKGVDTVILQEDVTLGDGKIAFRGGIKPGANTRRAGEDVEKGDEILSEGRVLTPADLALASATGLARLPVRSRLRVAIISTGDELREPGDEAGPGQIYDANRPLLLSLARKFGYVAVDLGRVEDDREALRRVLDRGSVEADVILTSGGASAGDEDHVSALLNETGAMSQWRIAVKPGRPLALGLWQDTPVFGLPGNPVAAMVCTLIFARPAMRRLAGETWRAPHAITVPAAFEKSKKPGRREFLRARLRDGKAEIFKSEGSGRISGLSWAEGLIELPDGEIKVQPGDPVRYLPFTAFY
ncbi:gephyrin-like molybdotransferase Glp [Roseovarius aestuariivivens]|uniref:molybdopterin-binding protein n=1 Tax=Roseovarius aestuariivivens TaxID=1888910 RepID=UPI0010814FE3|nr:gephyrin-like molybdotransferase Glp [Roseovarius aestuariivivens]